MAGSTPVDPRDAAPIGPDEAETLLASLAQSTGLVLAVSGGADSTALMLLAARWGRSGGRSEGRPAIHIATVDHGLRMASAGEAATVAAWAAAQGLTHATLTWTGRKPAAGIQAAARQARYALLEAHALAVGASHVVAAHHADDQAETVVMRMARGSGPAGLAGMRAERDLGPVRLARPLLSVSKARLIATLREHGHGWIEDPSNSDERYGRTAIRRMMPALAAAGLDRKRLLTLSRRLAEAEESLVAATAQSIGEAVVTTEETVVVAATALAGPVELARRVLVAALERAAPGMPPVPLRRLERLLDAIRTAAEAGEGLTRTAGTCVLRLRHGQVTITAEKERRRGRSRPVHGPQTDR